MVNNNSITHPAWANFAIVDQLSAPPIAWYVSVDNARRELARLADLGHDYSLIHASEVPLSR